MSGTTVKIPSSKSLGRDLESVKIYLYIKRHGFTELSIKEAAKSYGKSVLTARRYALKVSKVLGVEDMLEGDDLNNYLTYVKSVEDLDSYYLTKAEAKQETLREKRKEAEKLDSDIEAEEDLINEILDNQESLSNYDEALEDSELDGIIDTCEKPVEDSCEVKEFWCTCDKPWVAYLKDSINSLNLEKEVVFTKYGTYLRLLGNNNNPIANILLTSKCAVIDLYFNSIESKLRAQEELSDLKVKDYCKSAFTVKNVVDIPVIDRLVNILRKEHKNG